MWSNMPGESHFPLLSISYRQQSGWLLPVSGEKRRVLIPKMEFPMKGTFDQFMSSTEAARNNVTNISLDTFWVISQWCKLEIFFVYPIRKTQVQCVFILACSTLIILDAFRIKPGYITIYFIPYYLTKSYQTK